MAAPWFEVMFDRSKVTSLTESVRKFFSRGLLQQMNIVFQDEKANSFLELLALEAHEVNTDSSWDELDKCGIWSILVPKDGRSVFSPW
jgi:hypothetical protein